MTAAEEPRSLDRCYTCEWHEREIKTIWQKIWQMAGRVEEIPNVGDSDVCAIAQHHQQGRKTIFTGRYEDELKGVNGQWQFARHKLHQDLPPV